MNAAPSARRSLPLWLWVLLSALLSALAACSDSPPPAPIISVQLSDTAATAGSAATLSVAASGPDLAYQWQQSTDNGASWSNIATATDATYNTGLTTLAQNGERYRALANNSAGNASSNAALLTVNPAPQARAITAQPSNQSVTELAAASFTAAASGVPTPTWQWQLSTDGGTTWANINGATAAGYTTPATSVADSGKRYRAVAGNASGNVNSNAALLTVSAAAPAPLSSAKVAAAFRHTCAIKSDATLNCWGYNSSAQLGSGDRNSYLAPNPVAGLTGVTAVATGSNDTCAIHGGGNLSCWGNTSVLLPVAVAGYSGVQAVAVGATHKCFITSAGNVRCAGNNSVGQLGDGTTTTSVAPVLVISAANGANIDNVVALAAGSFHTCALVAGGNVLCWGAVTQSHSAVPMPGVSTAVALAAGEGAPCVLLADTTVQCWAGTAAGTPPQTVAGLSGVTSLAIGSQHACAVLGDTRVKCWGNGLMGNGNVSETQPTPQFVGGLTGVKVLAAGFQHTCALRNDRSMLCWGSNNEGQLGTGDTASRTTPTAVLGGASFAAP